MKKYQIEIEIQATAEKIWAVMNDLENWPTWTSSISKMERKRTGAIEEGLKVKIFQPKLAPAVWTVTKMEKGKEFEWTTGNFILKILANHKIAPGPNSCRVTLSVEFSGLFSGMAAKKYGDLTASYLETEAKGLKAFCEN